MTDPTKVCPHCRAKWLPEFGEYECAFERIAEGSAPADAAPIAPVAAGEVEAALRELVACKDLKDKCLAEYKADGPANDAYHKGMKEYEYRKTLAWAAARRALAPKAAQDKCDGNHGGPPCADPECWSKEPT